MLVNRAKAEEAAEALGLSVYMTDGGLDDVTVKLAYKEKAKVTHPDAGGSPEAFARVDWAKHVLLAWLAKRPSATPAMPVKGENCPACQGLGTVWQLTGFKRGMKRMCGQCSGTGEQSDVDRTGEGL